jgi:hypothetical protein
MAFGRHLLVLSSLGVMATGLYALPGQSKATKLKRQIDFNRDIRPIIDKCTACHGHDSKTVLAGLRLDTREGATKKLDSGRMAIVPGKPNKSELIKRVNSKDKNDIMPPPSSNKVLSAEEKKLLAMWIQEGAEFKQHWSFVKAVRPQVPTTKLKTWAKSPIDSFVLAKLEENKLKPSPETDRRTLIRRVSLDLNGLPPTPEEVSNFVNDKSPKAYEKVVDRLLASKRYGERMAMDWLDYARYADSNGYQADWERFQWKWRDWVIDAFNSDMPYDQFTIKQIAGDLLPSPTLDDKIATGFNRNHRINTEGGVIAEEWRIENVIDRVETTSDTWLGLTVGCARCHDHKYDPLTQKEFYSLFSYFNNVPESGSGDESPINHPPVLKAPSPAQAAMLKTHEANQAALSARLAAFGVKNAAAASKWNVDPNELPVQEGRIAEYKLGKAPSVLSGNFAAPTVVGEVGEAKGRFGTSVIVNEKAYLDLGQVGDFDTNQPFSFSLWVNSTDGNGSPISKMDNPGEFQGWDVFMQGGRPAVHIISKWPERALKVTSRSMMPNKKWNHLTVTYDGSAKPEGLRIYVNGIDAGADTEANSLSGSCRTKVSCKIGRRTGGDFFRGQVEGVTFYNQTLKKTEVEHMGNVFAASEVLNISAEKRTKEQADLLVRIWSRDNDPEYRKLDDELLAVKKSVRDLDEKITTVMVMEEMAKPRQAFVLVRGLYDHKGEDVKPSVPKFLPGLPAGAPNNRLGLAKWLVDPANPLTSRVTANRMWERLFGTGLVETSEDFGTRASFPSHPELLDWLATEIVRLKWDQKALWKQLVMSATYRQSSKVTPELVKLDPLNRLIARGPRFRLTAEVLRDQAMFFGNILTEKIGGPSVRPYQPNGVWDEMNVYGNLRNYKHDMDENLRRRSLYTIWKRTAAPPNMTLFDMSTRETCRVRRARTSTPLQALNMLNDVTYVEAARALGQRMLQEGGSSAESRLKFAYRVVLAREPSVQENKILTAGLARRLAHYKTHKAEAIKLIGEGDLKNPSHLDPSSLAAYTLVASTILNLDETLTKE